MSKNVKFSFMQGGIILVLAVIQVLVYVSEDLFNKSPDWFVFYNATIIPFSCVGLGIIAFLSLYEIIRHKHYKCFLIITQCLGAIVSMFSYTYFLKTYSGDKVSEVIQFIFVPYLIVTAVSVLLWILYVYLNRRTASETK